MAITRVDHAIFRLAALLPGSSNHRVTFLPAQQAVWYRVPKVATNSVQRLFDEHPAIETDTIPGKMKLPACMCRNWMRFGFVRHPVSRIHSAWKDKVLQSNFFELPESLYQEVQEFDGFLDWLSGINLQSAEPHIRQQSSLMPVQQMHFIGKIESLNEDIERLFTTWQLTPPALKQVNKTPPQMAPTSAQESIIRRLYAADFGALYPSD